MQNHDGLYLHDFLSQGKMRHESTTPSASSNPDSNVFPESGKNIHLYIAHASDTGKMSKRRPKQWPEVSTDQQSKRAYYGPFNCCSESPESGSSTEPETYALGALTVSSSSPAVRSPLLENLQALLGRSRAARGASASPTVRRSCELLCTQQRALHDKLHALLGRDRLPHMASLSTDANGHDGGICSDSKQACTMPAYPSVTMPAPVAYDQQQTLSQKLRTLLTRNDAAQAAAGAGRPSLDWWPPSRSGSPPAAAPQPQVRWMELEEYIRLSSAATAAANLALPHPGGALATAVVGRAAAVDGDRSGLHHAGNGGGDGGKGIGGRGSELALSPHGEGSLLADSDYDSGNYAGELDLRAW